MARMEQGLRQFNSMGRKLEAVTLRDPGHVLATSLRPCAKPGCRWRRGLRNKKTGSKVRERVLKKVPIQIALGAREAEEQTVTFRRHGAAETQTLPLPEAVALLLRDARDPVRT